MIGGRLFENTLNYTFSTLDLTGFIDIVLNTALVAWQSVDWLPRVTNSPFLSIVSKR